MSGEGSLEQALGHAAVTVGYVTAPGGSHFMTLEDTGWRAAVHDHHLDLQPLPDDAYDVHAWNDTQMVHWWWDQRRRVGRWAILDNDTVAANGWTPLTPTRHLLRGHVDETQDGWARAWDGNARAFWVPVGHQDAVGHRCAFRVVEYLSVDHEHGNAGVTAERISGLEVLP